MKSIFAICVLTLFFAGSTFGECSSSDKKTLEAFDRAWGDAGVKGNRSALLAIYADDYTGLPGRDNKTQTIDDTMKAFETDRTNPTMADKVTHDHYLISCTANSATITHRNTIWTPNGEGGKPQTFYTRSVHVLEKRGGKWLVVSNAGNNLDEYATLWYLEQDWNDAIQKQDKAWFDANYAADFTSISGTSAKLMNKTDDIADAVNDKMTMEHAETTGMNIRIDGKTAIVTGTFRTKGKDEKGTAFDRTVRYTDVWIKRDGRWQAWSSQGTLIP
ncbi:MAG: nuclear transport factor 2 family protein [Pyrinomonadaceae bacterium]